MKRVAATAGATGLIGHHLATQLPSHYEKVYSLGRRPSGIGGIEELKTDFLSMPQLELDLAGADLFCTLGTTIKKAGSQEAFRAVDFDAVLNFAKWGQKRGATRFFIVTAMGADSKSKIFYNRVKGEVEEALANLGFQELHIFRPSLLLGQRSEVRLGEKVAESVFGVLSFAFVGPLAAVRPIDASVVAHAMVRIAAESKAAESSGVGARVKDKSRVIYPSNIIQKLGE